MIDAKKLARKIMGLSVEQQDGDHSDTIGTMLCLTFEDAAGNIGKENTDWVVNHVDLLEKKIAELIEQELKMNNELLDKLTREDLIVVIANMHDTIQEWDSDGYALSITGNANKLAKIGSACVEYCSKINSWDVKDI